MKVTSTSFTVLNEQAELHITAKGISSEDALILKKSNVKFGVQSSGSVLLFSHQGIINDQVTIEFFNVNLADRTFIRRSKRNLLKVLLLEEQTRLIKCVKIVTLDSAFTDKLASLTVAQMDSHFSIKSFFAQCRMIQKNDLDLFNNSEITLTNGGLYI